MIDRVLSALDRDDWRSWSQICLATDLTLFQVREAINQLVEADQVEVLDFGSIFKFRLKDQFDASGIPNSTINNLEIT